VKYKLGLFFPNFDTVFMNCLIIYVVIKIADWMKCWYESILLPYSSHLVTKTLRYCINFQSAFLILAGKISLLPLCVADFYESFWESYTIRVCPYFVQFPTVINTNKTSVWVVKWKQHKYGSKTVCDKIYSRHVQLLFL
jgi:hypothetical protein